MRPRSADRLGALTSDWLGMKVEIVEFAGAWLSLPPDQRTLDKAIAANATFQAKAFAAKNPIIKSAVDSGKIKVSGRGFERRFELGDERAYWEGES